MGEWISYVKDHGGLLLGAAAGGANLDGHGRMGLLRQGSDLLAKHKAGKRECGGCSQHFEICRRWLLLPKRRNGEAVSGVNE